MPYINDDSNRRAELEEQMKALEPEKWEAGDFAYVIFRLMDRFCTKAGRYSRRALTSGIVVETWAEWRRRRTVPFESEKILENGDVPAMD